jgi:ribosome-associated toxin RatA of RatAB toxin-antitoxin module
MYTMTIDRIVNAPANIVWDVISDIERYADYAPNLSKAVKTSSGITPTRTCWDTNGGTWNEACVLWDEGHEYAFIVDTSSYPYPYAYVKGTWGLETVSDGVRVYMHFAYAPEQGGVLGWLVHLSTKRLFQPIVDELMDNWESEIMSRTQKAVA